VTIRQQKKEKKALTPFSPNFLFLKNNQFYLRSTTSTPGNCLALKVKKLSATVTSG
jgi:hypothetical protein